MVSGKYKVGWKTLLIPIVGLLAFFIYILIFNVDILQIVATISNANPYLYLAAAIVSILDVMFFSAAWNLLLRFLKVKISMLKSFLYVWFGIYIDILIPAESISGEISKIYLLSRDHDGTTGEVTASLVAQRLMSMGINVGTLFLGAVLLLLGNQLAGILLNLILFLVSLTFAFLVLILLLCVKEKWTLAIVDAIIRFVEFISRKRWKLANAREEIESAAKAFHCAMRDFAHAPKTLLISSFFYIIAWIANLGTFYMVFMSLGYASISWSVILIVSSIFMAVKSIPIGVPFEVGLPEIALTSLFILLGVPPDISATATILNRLLTLWLRFFIGFAVQQWIGVKVAAATSMNQNVPNTSGTGKV